MNEIANISAPPPQQLALLPKMLRQRAAAAAADPATWEEIPADLSVMLAPLLPEFLLSPPSANPLPPEHIPNRREFLRECLPPQIERDGDTWSVEFGEPPAGISAPEGVLWPELGRACAKAALFIYEWLKTRRYLRASELSGCPTSQITLMRNASPVFAMIYERAESIVRAGRVARTEDTLHALANGDFRKEKRITKGDGEVTTIDEGAIYDVKAAALELAANDPRYAPRATGGGGVQIQLNISVPRPIDVKEAQVIEDKEVRESGRALPPHEVIV